MIKIFMLLLIAAVLFVSCLSVKSEITLREDGTGEWSMQYRIPQELLYITPGPEFRGFDYFPADEEGVVERTNSIPGLLLISVSSSETPDFVEINTRIAFTDSNDIELFFNNYTETPVLKIDTDNKGVFGFEITPPYVRELDTDTFNIISALYSQSAINVRVDLPGIVTESSAGLLSENPSQAELEIKFTDLLSSDEPVEWIVNYE